MGSHSVTCHPAAVTLTHLPHLKLVLNLETLEGCNVELPHHCSYTTAVISHLPNLFMSTSGTRRRCLTQCIADIYDWMKTSRRRLNPAKSQIMWLSTSQQLEKITVRDVPLLSTEVTVVDSVRNLSVIIDSQLSLAAQCTCCRCLSQWLLPATATSSSHGVSVS